MRRFGVALLVSLAVPMVIAAQTMPTAGQGSEESKATVFGGFSLLRNGGNTPKGWDGQATFNFTRFLGITADIAGNYRPIASFSPLPGVSASVNQSLYTFLFGPTVTGNFGRSAIFAHALFGAARAGSSAGVSLPIIGGVSTGLNNATAFAMAFGAGVDIGLTRHIAIRALQLDYIRTNFSATDALTTGLSTSMSGAQNSYRYSGGIVIRF